jgi:transcription initiation factor IIF auxiliary subunit
MTEKQLFTYTNTVIASELLSNYLEDLKDTPVYRQQIKHHSKELALELEKMLKTELPKIFEVEEEFTVNLMRDYKDLVENLTSASADDLMVISQLIKAYKGDRDKFLDKFEINLTKIDE